MINKQLAVNLKIQIDPSAARGWHKPDINRDVALADRGLMSNPLYAALGDVRQAPLAVLTMQGETKLVDRILAAMMEQHEADAFDPVAVGKIITASAWGKKNKKAAKVMSCSMISGKPCANKSGCNCGSKD